MNLINWERKDNFNRNVVVIVEEDPVVNIIGQYLLGDKATRLSLSNFFSRETLRHIRSDKKLRIESTQTNNNYQKELKEQLFNKKMTLQHLSRTRLIASWPLT